MNKYYLRVSKEAEKRKKSVILIIKLQFLLLSKIVESRLEKR